MDSQGADPGLWGEVCGRAVLDLMLAGRTRDACDCLNAAIALGPEAEAAAAGALCGSERLAEAVAAGDAVQVLDWLVCRGYLPLGARAGELLGASRPGSRVRAYVSIAGDPGLARARAEAWWAPIPPLFLCAELLALFLLRPGAVTALGCCLALGAIWGVRAGEGRDDFGWGRAGGEVGAKGAERGWGRFWGIVHGRGSCGCREGSAGGEGNAGSEGSAQGASRPRDGPGDPRCHPRPPPPRIYVSSDYCPLCARPKYKGQTHCRYCGRCTREFDHHCLWYNCCVHLGNYAPFLASVGCLLCLVLFCLASLALEHRRRGPAGPGRRLLTICQFAVFAMLTNTAMLHLRKVLKRRRLVA